MTESRQRSDAYFRLLSSLDARDFVEACDRILWQDEWFPTIARLRTVVAECAADRRRSEQALESRRPVARLVCPYCHGARWVSAGGYDPPNMHAGDDGSRAHPCPGCTHNGAYDQFTEGDTIRREGGVPDPNAGREVDMSRQTWPAQLHAMRDPETGRIDMERLYQESRRLRGLPPGDDRPQAVAGFKTFGQASEREMVGVGVDDDVPF